MALKVEKGVFLQPGSTGNQTITLADTGFGTVKAVLVFAIPAPSADADGGTNGNMTIGLGTYRGSAVKQWSVGYWDQDAAGTSVTERGHTSSSLLHAIANDPPTTDYDAALVSLGDHQFVINWTVLSNLNQRAHYLALGGADITDALVGTFDLTSAAGTQNVTVATGFGQPDLIICVAAVPNTTESDTAGSANLAFGVGIDDSNERHTAWTMEDGRPSMETMSHQTATLLALADIDTALTYNIELSAKASWPTDGFQVNKVTAPGASCRIGYLALKGSFSKAVGVNTAPTAAPTVTQDLALGQTPRGAVFFHNAIAANTALDNSAADLGTFGLGATDGTNQGWVGVGNDDANGTSVAHIHSWETRAVKMFTPSASGTLTSDASASVSGTNIRLTWADTDTVAREYCYLLLGDGVSDHPLDCQPGSFGLTGLAATLAAGRLFDAAFGTYTISGVAALLAVGRFVSSDPGAYTVTGAAASLVSGRAVLADPASYTVTGTAATLAAGRVFASDPAAYTVTGTAATLAGGFATSADPASYAVTGADATLVHTTVGAYTLNTEPGTFTVTGTDATLAAARVFDASPGTYTVTGLDAGLVLAVPGVFVLDATAGTVTVTGSNATTIATRILSADPGATSISGFATTLFAEHGINAATGTYAVTGADAAVVADRMVDASFGTYTVTGTAASLGQIFDFEIDSAPGTYTVTGTAATLDFAAGRARDTTRGGRIRWNFTGRFRGENRPGRITQNQEGSVT